MSLLWNNNHPFYACLYSTLKLNFLAVKICLQKGEYNKVFVFLERKGQNCFKCRLLSTWNILNRQLTGWKKFTEKQEPCTKVDSQSPETDAPSKTVFLWSSCLRYLSQDAMQKRINIFIELQ